MAIATGRISVLSSATQIVGARAGRKELRIKLGSIEICLGPDNTITSVSGYSSVGDITLLAEEGAVWGASTGNTREVQFLEIY